jgi:2-methylisocitrate lyase-like PEP mutase family enzyme
MRLSPQEKRKLLRQHIQGTEALIAPGIYDAYGAKLVSNAGFLAAYLTGNGVSASLLGHPDIGQVDLTLMTDHARRIASCIDIPLICDADTGYGGVFNIQRTVQEFEAAGVCAIHIEDQRFPKKCAQFEGARTVLDFKEAMTQIKAAVKSRVDSNMLIIARTDCAASLGIDHAIERANAFVAEGADAVFVELKPSASALEQIRKIKDQVDTICLFNVDVGGAVSELTATHMKSAGVDIAIHPSLGRGIFGYAMQTALNELKLSGNIAPLKQRMLSGSEYNQSLDLAYFEQWEQQFFNQ